MIDVSNQTAVQRRGAAKVLTAPKPARKLLVPREHGSWGLWVLPLIIGAIAGAAHARGSYAWALFWLCVAATSAFLAYQPLEALLGSSLLRVRTAAERKIATRWVVLASASCGISAAALVRLGRGSVLWFAALGVVCFATRSLLGQARRFRVMRQILGVLSLSSTGAAAYYVTAGELDKTAILLWGANWLFAIGQIEYVQLRVRTAATHTRSGKFATAARVAIYHLALLAVASAAALTNIVHPLAALAFVPSMARIAFWTTSKPAKTNFHFLGFSELFQGILFNSFLLAAFLRH